MLIVSVGSLHLLLSLLHFNENLMRFSELESHYRVQCDTITAIKAATVIIHQLQQSHHY